MAGSQPVPTAQTAESNIDNGGLYAVLREIKSIGRMPQCGNGLCEWGERDDPGKPSVCLSGLQSDCINIMAACPVGLPKGSVSGGDPAVALLCSGHGQCLGSTGRCMCHAGFAGPACDRCDTGYGMVNGFCAAVDKLSPCYDDRCAVWV